MKLQSALATGVEISEADYWVEAWCESTTLRALQISTVDQRSRASRVVVNWFLFSAVCCDFFGEGDSGDLNERRRPVRVA